MRNKELERIAALIARDGEEHTDGECLGDVWTYLRECGVDPDEFRACTCSQAPLCPLCQVNEDARVVAEWEDDDDLA